MGQSAPPRLGRAHLVMAAVAGWALLLTATFALLFFQPHGDVLAPAHLTPADKSLTGSVDSTLAAKITYDAAAQEYVFNAAGKKSPAAAPAPPGSDAYKKRSGLYSVDLPVDPGKGFTYYNNDLGLSFTIVPRFPMGRAQLIGGHVVYPLADGGQAVYSVKGNGLEEDIILHSPVAAATYKYQLHLPDTLQAKRLPNSGSIGIYSADARLFEHISFSTASDRQKVESARKNSPKTNLAFALPEPVIKQNNPGPHNGTGNVRFAMSGSSVSVIGEGLRNLSYPISLDPSVVINTYAGFAAGNNEGNIDFVGNQVNRGGLTGGALGSWTTLTGTPLPVTTRFATSVVANGYVYEIGGDPTGTGSTANVYYSQLGANGGGTLGSWNTSAYTLPLADKEAVSVAYDGYIYVFGGCTTTCPTTAVYYTKAGATGETTAWSTATSSLLTAVMLPSVAVYDDYVYVVGGCTNSGCTTEVATTQYAKLNADGTVGSWTTSATTLAAAESAAVSAAYNGYIYEIGGYTTAGIANVYYASIKNNGDINAWTATSSLPAATYDAAVVVDNGYVYALGSNGASSAAYYAPFYANGTLGTWVTNSNSLPSATSQETAVAWNGYVFSLGGCIAACPGSTVVSAPLEPAGYLGPWTSTTALSVSRQDATSVAYNGYIYELGGYSTANGGKYKTNVDFAPVNSNGTLGAWTSTTALPAGLRWATTVAYDGYIYELGGQISSSLQTAVYYAAINSNGTVGAWTTSPATLPAATEYAASAAYNGYLYELGGCTGTTACNAPTASVYYSGINSNGSLAGWNSTSNLYWATENAGAAAYEGYMYTIGDANNQSYLQRATINSDGTLGTWSAATFSTPPGAIGAVSATMAFSNGYFYVLGGCIMPAPSCPSALVYDESIDSLGNGGGWVATTSLPVATQDATSAVANGYIYEIGGDAGSGSDYTTVDYAPIGNGGAGNPGAWASTSNLQTGVSLGSSVANNGYLYELGGCPTSCPTATVQYASVSSDGTLGAWGTTQGLPAAVNCTQTVTYKGIIYEVGGMGDSACSSTLSLNIYYAKPNSDGTISSWSTNGTTLPSSWAGSVAAAYNGYIYYLPGGSSTFYYAAINGDGSVGSWVSTSSLSSTTEWAASAVYNGYLYVIGGCNGSTCASSVFSAVYVTHIQANGSLGTWNATTSLPVPTYEEAAVAYDGYLYEMGGYASGSGVVATTYYAPLDSDGTVGAWTVAPSMPAGRDNFTATAYNGYIYGVGGCNTSCATYYSSVPVIPRVGHYSKLIDLGVTNATLTTIGYNGRLRNDTADISFATAGSAGTFSAQALASALTGANGASNIRYVWVFVTLDNSDDGPFPDTWGGANLAYLTSITINYTIPCTHAAPGVRLRGGKSFSSGAQTPLDTCFP